MRSIVLIDIIIFWVSPVSGATVQVWNMLNTIVNFLVRRLHIASRIPARYPKIA